MGVQIAALIRHNQNAVNWYLTAMCIRIAHIYKLESPLEEEVEIDESYFAAKKEKGKRDLGASVKMMVFGISNHNGKVNTESD